MSHLFNDLLNRLNIDIFKAVRLPLQPSVNFDRIVLFPSDIGPDRDINWIINLHDSPGISFHETAFILLVAPR